MGVNFSSTMCDITRATLHNIYLYHNAVCNLKSTRLMRTLDNNEQRTLSCVPRVTKSHNLKPPFMGTVYLRAVFD